VSVGADGEFSYGGSLTETREAASVR
jgi:hypothetical protein